MKLHHFVLVVSACACAEDFATDELQAPIENGIPTSAWPAVVALADPQGQPFCSGTFAVRRCVFTAAHCGNTHQVRLGPDAWTSNKVSVVRRSVFKTEARSLPALKVREDMAFHWTRHDGSIDHALDYTPIPISFTRPANGTPITAVGYGNFHQNAWDYGIKRMGDGAVAYTPSGKIGVQLSPYDLNPGDSGGPALGGGGSVTHGVASIEYEPGYDVAEYAGTWEPDQVAWIRDQLENFCIPFFPVSANHNGGGRVVANWSGTPPPKIPVNNPVIDCGTDCFERLPQGQLTFQAVAGTGSRFITWNTGTGCPCGGSSNPTCTVALTGGPREDGFQCYAVFGPSGPTGPQPSPPPR